MINDAVTDVLEVLQSCRCCLLRPPDKGLKTPYTHLDKTEVYSDMIQECFAIHLSLENEECGICEECVGWLRDARDFKLQVQRSQAELRAWREGVLRVKDEPLVKSEVDENDMSDGYYSTLNEEPPPKAEMSSDDAMGDEDPISLTCDGCAPAPAEPARAAAARAREQLAMACSVRLERLRDDKAPHASPTCRQTFRHEATLAAHARGHARHYAGPGEENLDTPQVHKGKEMYTCDYCAKQVTLKISLIKHLRAHVTKTSYAGKNSSIKISNNNFDTINRLVSTDRIKPYACDICGKQFTRKGHLKRHISVHTGQRPYACDICSKKFTLNQSLKKHQLVHSKERPYICDLCGKQFTQKSHLKRHIISVHTGDRLYACDICSKKFTLNQSLKKHQLVHTRERPYACDVCRKQFIRKGHLKRHVISVHPGYRLYACDICPKKFTNSLCLKKHQLVHTGKKTYICDVCGKQFPRKLTLKQHIRVHTGHRPYSCDYCSKTFTTSSNLTRHQRIHTGIKAYACDVCGKQFTQKGHLKQHISVHTGLKPYFCSICPKKFTHRHHLTQHISVHTGQRLYFCEYCLKAFKTSSNLTQHQRVHTKKSYTYVESSLHEKMI